MADIILSEKDIHRFWNMVSKLGPEECWPWLGSRFRKGYGQFGLTVALNSVKNLRAHRISWIIHRGQIPPLALVCHSCDNPPCVNPSHLWLGNVSDNTQDMMDKKRNKYKTFSCENNGSAKLTNEQVTQIRARLQAGEIQRKIAADYGVSQMTISHISKRSRWSSLP